MTQSNRTSFSFLLSFIFLPITSQSGSLVFFFFCINETGAVFFGSLKKKHGKWTPRLVVSGVLCSFGKRPRSSFRRGDGGDPPTTDPSCIKRAHDT
jgi:hypothetical protein